MPMNEHRRKVCLRTDGGPCQNGLLGPEPARAEGKRTLSQLMYARVHITDPDTQDNYEVAGSIPGGNSFLCYKIVKIIV